MTSDNRAKLLRCALRLFSARGYDAVGVQEIVEAAGVTKPTLYHYFNSKQGLLDALLEENYALLHDAIRVAAVYQWDLPLTLTNIANAYFDYAYEHPIFYRMQLAMRYAPPISDAHKAVARWNVDQQRILERMFLQAAEQHGNMRGRHHAYAATFLGMINTYIGLALDENLTLNDDLVYRATHQFMHGIYS